MTSVSKVLNVAQFFTVFRNSALSSAFTVTPTVAAIKGPPPIMPPFSLSVSPSYLNSLNWEDEMRMSRLKRGSVLWVRTG